MSIKYKILNLSLLINLGGWLFIASQIKAISAPMVLHYQAVMGPSLLGAGGDLFSLPLAGLLIIIINSLLIYFILDKSYGLILSESALFVQVVLTIGGIMIILVN